MKKSLLLAGVAVLAISFANGSYAQVGIPEPINPAVVTEDAVPAADIKRLEAALAMGNEKLAARIIAGAAKYSAGSAVQKMMAVVVKSKPSAVAQVAKEVVQRDKAIAVKVVAAVAKVSTNKEVVKEVAKTVEKVAPGTLQEAAEQGAVEQEVAQEAEQEAAQEDTTSSDPAPTPPASDPNDGGDDGDDGEETPNENQTSNS